ncbi:MAG: asparagine synthase (glutamine-hydrolyzing), partial [Rhodothermales bacterium]|nr:asparagine synthase (glutamine-hydrolyzing) [Rhodothermales bacterium]
MCGIAGVVGAPADSGRHACETMLDAMVHRGPDQDGLWQSNSEKPVTLGHRRLSIIDVSEAGRQPMIDATTGVVLSYNGECYNFLELRSKLQGKGRRFASTSDTEVLLAAYLEWGESTFSMLRGMFALAIWDPRDQHLLLVRDRLGIKPLYYSSDSEGLYFASELRALLSSGCVERKLDPRAVHSYLWHGFVPGPRSLVSGVRLLDAGNLMRIDQIGREVSTTRYWDLPRFRRAGDHSTNAESAHDVLQTAVTQHLHSDVPLGVFLSGGIDSSVVASMASKASDAPVTTFNVRFEESRYDESEYARAVAKALNTDHKEVTLSETMFDSQLDDALESIDQPTFDAINTYFVSRAVREAGLTVALAGTGGDELFGGYSSFADIPRARLPARLLGSLPKRARDLLAQAAARMLMGQAGEIPPQTRWGKLADVLETR